MTSELMQVGIRPSGYRLPDEARVGRVRLQVSDLRASLPYYTDVLGLRVLSQERAVAVLGVPGGSALIELHERRGVRRVPRRGLLGLYHFAILLPDRAALGRFVTHLREVGASAASADHLVSEALYLADPDGLGIEVYADRPREQWPTRGREIAMATEPLDLRALVRAAGVEPWTGMPAGTTIGHVHFHVGTIREAEAFYHSALGFDKVAWTLSGRVVLFCRWLPPSRRNEYVGGRRTGRDWRRCAPPRMGAPASTAGRRCGGRGQRRAGRL